MYIHFLPVVFLRLLLKLPNFCLTLRATMLGDTDNGGHGLEEKRLILPYRKVSFLCQIIIETVLWRVD